MAPKQLLNDETYKPARRSTENADTDEAIIKFSCKLSLAQVDARNKEKIKYKIVLWKIKGCLKYFTQIKPTYF